MRANIGNVQNQTIFGDDDLVHNLLEIREGLIETSDVSFEGFQIQVRCQRQMTHELCRENLVGNVELRAIKNCGELFGEGRGRCLRDGAPVMLFMSFYLLSNKVCAKQNIELRLHPHRFFECAGKR